MSTTLWEDLALITIGCRKANDVTETNTESESPTTRNKASSRSGRNVLGDSGRGRKAKALSEPVGEEVDEEDADKVASMIGSERSSPQPISVSSDDFGGYD